MDEKNVFCVSRMRWREEEKRGDMAEINFESRIYVAGHRGLVGSALCRQLVKRGYRRILTRTSSELDLRDGGQVERFFDEHRPEVVLLAAAKVGGIHANSTWPADFILDNIGIESNVIRSALKYGCDNFLFLGSSCIYPRLSPQPMPETCLLTSALEPTNEPYAIAKIAGLKMCEAIHRQYGKRYFAVMPTNLYGPGDNYNLETSHVIPAMIRRFHEAKVSGAERVVLWGTGMPRREFLYADDMADACLHLLFCTDVCELVNVGTGEDMTIREAANLIAEVVGYEGKIEFDSTHPDGTPRKLLDLSKLRATGWRAKVAFREGIVASYRAFLAGEMRM